MHRVEVNTDRHDRRPDPVAAREGVFGETRPEELSEAELARLGSVDRMAWEASRRADLAAQSADIKTQSRWSVTAIAARLTALYARFTKPNGGA